MLTSSLSFALSKNVPEREEAERLLKTIANHHS
jgi:hypothetical protein